MNRLKILFFGKKNQWGDLALSFLENLGQDVIAYRGDHGENFPDLTFEPVDLIVSFSCPWVLPENLLKNAKLAAINFHPGSPDYPGIGCTNFALYEDQTVFGVVCHHMAGKVDSGEIIATKYFPILNTDSVKDLTDRTYFYLYYLYNEIMDKILNENKVPVSSEKWRKIPYTRQQLNELCRISPSMDLAEIRKRIKSVTFPGKPGAYIDIQGILFSLKDEK